MPHMCVNAQREDSDSANSSLCSTKGVLRGRGPNQDRGVNFMSVNTQWADTPNDVAGPVSNTANHVVLMVVDRLDARPELRQVLQLNGYRVIDTDNGLDAARNARQTQPDLLLVDMDVPLLYGLVAARQIIKHA